MKAAVLTDWKHIEVKEVDIPVAGPGEVLIEVIYAGICGSDVHIFHGTNPIAKTPLIPGHEFVGTVASLGLDVDVDEISIGQRVAVQPLVFCGTCAPCRRGILHVCANLVVIGANRNGAFSRYVSVPIDGVFPISDALSDETAALAEPFSIAMHSSRRGGLTPDDRVLIIGGVPSDSFRHCSFESWVRGRFEPDRAICRPTQLCAQFWSGCHGSDGRQRAGIGTQPDGGGGV